MGPAFTFLSTNPEHKQLYLSMEEAKSGLAPLDTPPFAAAKNGATNK